jgi:hypothetical protein
VNDIPEDKAATPAAALPAPSDAVEMALDAFGQALKAQKAKNAIVTQLLDKQSELQRQQDEIKQQIVTASREQSDAIIATQKCREQLDTACDGLGLSHRPSEDGAL